jgi:hypothetical protein
MKMLNRYTIAEGKITCVCEKFSRRSEIKSHTFAPYRSNNGPPTNPAAKMENACSDPIQAIAEGE